MAINYQGGNDAVITGSFGGLMQTLQRNYMAEQQNKQDIRKQRDAILQESQKDLAKINSNGIRKADLPEFDKMYGGIKDTYYKMLTAKTPTEQRALAMQINEGLGQINSLVSQSKEVQKWENGAVDNFKNLVGQRGERDYMTHVRSGFDKPSSQLNKEYFDSSPYLNRWDEQKGNDSVQKAIQDGFKNAKNYTTLAPEVGSTYNVGERRLADVTYRDRLNPDFVLNTVSNLYQTNKDVRGQVDDMISTGQALDLNDALTKYAGIFNSDIERVSTNKGVNTQKSKGVQVTVNNMPSPAVSSNYYNNSVGDFTSNQSTTYSEDVPLVGTREVYTKTGQKYPVEFKGELMKGGVLMTLPVDSQGAPLPTNKNGEAKDQSKVAGYGEFLGGVLPKPENLEVSKMVDSRMQSIFNDNALLPMSQIQWIGQSKPKRADLQGKQNQTRSQSQALQGGKVR